eukprot:2280508-Rhodomonas_salina.1
MSMCIHKCEVAGFDFNTGQELPQSALKLVRYGPDTIPRLAADVAVRYLGLRLNIKGETQAE